VDETADIAFVGGGPAALVAAIALARRGIRTTVFERDAHPQVAPRFDPDRSYTIDISGHGLRALRHIDACSHFDDRLIQFKGLKILDQRTEEWTLPGWTGSRGDILRALMALAEEKHKELVRFEFECRVNTVDVQVGTLTCESRSGAAVTEQFDFIIGADGAGSVVRNAMLEQVAGCTVERKSLPNYCTMIELDRVGANWTRTIFMDCPIGRSVQRARSRAKIGPTRPDGSAPWARRRRWCSHPGKKHAASSMIAFRAYSS